MKTASILLGRDYVTPTELDWRIDHYDLLLGKVAPWESHIRTRNPNAELGGYVINLWEDGVISELKRISLIAMTVERAKIGSLLYDVPVNFSETPTVKHLQLALLGDVQRRNPGRRIWANAVAPYMLTDPPSTWEPWCTILRDVAGAYLLEGWDLTPANDAKVDAINAITKPMVIMFRRVENQSELVAKEWARTLAVGLDAPNRYFGYRDGNVKWINPASLETGWSYNELFLRG